jgi:hypothetical protein
MCCGLQSFAGSEKDEELSREVSEILKDCIRIKPGMTRAELMKIFTTQGGASSAVQRTYVHRRCHFIKVDIEFTLSSPKQDVLVEKPSDKINKISRPYLEFNVIEWAEAAVFAAFDHRLRWVGYNAARVTLKSRLKSNCVGSLLEIISVLNGTKISKIRDAFGGVFSGRLEPIFEASPRW